MGPSPHALRYLSQRNLANAVYSSNASWLKQQRFGFSDISTTASLSHIGATTNTSAGHFANNAPITGFSCNEVTINAYRTNLVHLHSCVVLVAIQVQEIFNDSVFLPRENLQPK